MDKKTAKKLIANNKKFYDAAADKFSSTRLFPWRDFEFIKKLVRSGDSVLDLGCGNGRFYQYLHDKKIKYLGVDVSKKLISKAKKLNPAALFKAVDILNFKSQEKYDLILMVAVLHHIPSDGLRKKILENIRGILKKDGILVVSCWNLWTPRYLKYITKRDMTKVDGHSLDKNDALVPFSDGENLIGKRYLHAFTKRELISLLKTANLKVLKNQSGQKNFIVIANKT